MNDARTLRYAGHDVMKLDPRTGRLEWVDGPTPIRYEEVPFVFNAPGPLHEDVLRNGRVARRVKAQTAEKTGLVSSYPE